MNLSECHGILEHERKITLNRRVARQRFIAGRMQRKLEKAVQIDFREINFLLDFANGGYIGMKLPKLGHQFTICQYLGRAARVVIPDSARLQLEVGKFESGQQRFQVALQIEEPERTRAVNASLHHIAGCAKADHFAFFRPLLTGSKEYVAYFKQTH